MIDLQKDGKDLDRNYLEKRLNYFSDAIDNYLFQSIECAIEREEFEYFTLKSLLLADLIFREDLYYPA
jgi:hypothetical protein